MKWYATRRRMLAIIVILFLTLIAFGLWGCTKRDEEAAKKAGGVVGTFFGMPPVVGESVVGALLLLTHTITAQVSHGRGRRRERSCHVTPPPKAAA
jgi:uncharacterized membrane protein